MLFGRPTVLNSHNIDTTLFRPYERLQSKTKPLQVQRDNPEFVDISYIVNMLLSSRKMSIVYQQSHSELENLKNTT